MIISQVEMDTHVYVLFNKNPTTSLILIFHIPTKPKQKNKPDKNGEKKKHLHKRLEQTPIVRKS